MKIFGRWAWTRVTTLGNDAGKGTMAMIAVLGLVVVALLGLYAHKHGLGKILPPATGK